MEKTISRSEKKAAWLENVFDPDLLAIQHTFSSGTALARSALGADVAQQHT